MVCPVCKQEIVAKRVLAWDASPCHEQAEINAVQQTSGVQCHQPGPWGSCLRLPEVHLQL